MALLKGKQIEGIQQQNMLIETSTITAKTSTTNKEYCVKKVNDKISKIGLSSANLNMQANITTNFLKLACNTPVIDIPISPIIVKVNGVMINVGEGLDAYFSPDESTIRVAGNAQKGDYLAWNTDVYNLDNDDEIDFIYLTKNDKFIIGSGFDRVDSGGGIWSIIQDGDKYLIGGGFTTYQEQTVYGIIRLNQDGSIDTTFNSGIGFDNVVYSIHQDGDKYVIGGMFTITYQGQSANHIIRLNQDGSIDTSFKYGSGFGGYVVKPIIQDGDKYVIGGGFTTYQEQSANNIIRLNQDGSIDTSFNYGSGFNNITFSIIQDGDKYVIGGVFTTYQGQSANHIIRLNQDGSIDSSFNIGSGFNDSIYSIHQDGDKYVIGGGFTTYQGQTYNRIIRLNQDGSIDTTFNSGTGFNDNVISILQDGDKYLIGGDFTVYQGLSTYNIIKLNQDGSIDTTSGLGAGLNGRVLSLHQDDDKYVIGGSFTSYQGQSASRIIRLNQDGSTNTYGIY